MFTANWLTGVAGGDFVNHDSGLSGVNVTASLMRDFDKQLEKPDVGAVIIQIPYDHATRKAVNTTWITKIITEQSEPGRTLRF